MQKKEKMLHDSKIMLSFANEKNNINNKKRIAYRNTLTLKQT